jgi:hypothetical protein
MKMSSTGNKKRTSSGSNELESPTKKPRKKSVTAKSLNLTKDEFNRIKAAPIKKELNVIVKRLAHEVNADWHDGYEEQAETKQKWFYAIQEPLQTVLDIGVGKCVALVQCNEILKIVSDSLYDLLAVPCRGSTMDDFRDMDGEFTLNMPWGGKLKFKCSHPYDIWSYIWVALLRVHSAKDDSETSENNEDILLRCIKDASDNMKGAEYMKFPGSLFLYDDKANLQDGKNVPSSTALDRLIGDKESAWKNLSTTKKEHRMRRTIDRRYDGSPSRRTRDFGDNDDY